jgi:hypothetical protein
MTASRKDMEKALKALVLPTLRRAGFKGSYPHLRRIARQGIDVLTFQFDRHGGGFVIEIARCPSDGIVTYWGKAISADKVTVWDIHPSKRKRIQEYDSSGTDGWFRYDRDLPSDIASALLARLASETLWQNP